MADPMTFETRFAAALDRYADRVPADVDVPAVVRATTAPATRGSALTNLRPRWSVGVRLATAIALLALGAAILVLIANRPALPLGGGRLLVGDDRGGWVFDPDLRTPLWISQRLTCAAKLVDGGAKLATSARFGPTWVQPIDGDVTTRVQVVGKMQIDGYGGTNSERWSPDGSHFALARFGRQSDDDPPTGRGAIKVISVHATASATQAIFDLQGLAAFGWSADSDHLAALRYTGDGMEIVVIDLETDRQRTIASYRAPGANVYQDVRWTAGDTRIVVQVGTDAGARPALVNAATGAVELVPDPAHLIEADSVWLGSGWSPDGTRVIAIRSDGSAFVLDSKGSKLFDLPAGELMGTNWGPEPWAPDSRHLALIDGRDLRIIGADGTDVGRLALNQALESPQGSFAWSPDGSAMAIARVHGGGIEVALYDPSTLERTAVTSLAVPISSPVFRVCVQWVPPVE